jgi:hypothetical protein
LSPELTKLQNNIAPTSELALKSDYHLFKEGVRPEWEDVQNKHGGKWSYQFKEKRNVPIDELWLHVMLAAIGETLEEEDDGELMGVVVNVRKGFYRIGVWTRTIGKSIPGGGDGDVAGGKGRSTEKGKEVLMNIGRKFKEVLKLPASECTQRQHTSQSEIHSLDLNQHSEPGFLLLYLSGLARSSIHEALRYDFTDGLSMVLLTAISIKVAACSFCWLICATLLSSC